MIIELNGDQRQVEATDLDALLRELQLASEVVATALNGEFVSRSERAATSLTDGDRVELLSPMQGG